VIVWLGQLDYNQKREMTKISYFLMKISLILCKRSHLNQDRDQKSVEYWKTKDISNKLDKRKSMGYMCMWKNFRMKNDD